MDINQLLYHHQMALMAAGQAQRDGNTLPNFDLPRHYAKRIDEYREVRGLSGALVLPAEPLLMNLAFGPGPAGGVAHGA
ncbi:hypothetical protein ATE67_17380 [Sphingopyxis sp. H050]|uniref:hypothetical protein n=1 Tax=Sphingopyxis sp. H050 TaxID=1759072 RepID=UPI0007367D81|nr:hypothetical protein [Sphingopyxis sp. H050]KTE18858.1 hypothetical protein ATE67_17380 [Sphingopyxis sp. H050]